MTRILFLCTGNSARSIMAESALNVLGGDRFEAFSAGSAPKGEVHPLAIEVLRAHGHPATGLRSKSWDEFSASGAPRLDLVITLCDSAAGESCPLWLGNPVKVHWGIPDPAAVPGDASARRAAFEETLAKLSRLLSKLVKLPDDALDPDRARSRLEEIGRAEAAVRPPSPRG
jgi:arsenate reductase